MLGQPDLRDYQFQTGCLKILLRRWHLFWLFLLHVMRSARPPR
jgi:hypothetical protein